MKIRRGFVSNSSTTSFSIYGIPVTAEEVLEIFGVKPNPEVKAPACQHGFDRETMKFCPECGKEAWSITPAGYDDDTEYQAECLAEEKGFDYVYGNSDDGDVAEGYYLGMNLRGNGGKREAKKHPEKMVEMFNQLKELFGKEADFYSGSFYQ